MKRKMLKIALSVLLVAILSVTSAACGGQSGETSPSAPAVADAGGKEEPFTLRIITQTGFNELNVADALGFFADENIKIEYTGTLGQGVTEFQLLEQGEIDAFTTSHPPNIAQARLAGVNAVAVAPGMIDSEELPHVRYLVRKDSPIQTLDEAIGHTVSMTVMAACADGYVKYYLQSKGLDFNDVEFITIAAPGAQEQSVLDGLVDIATSHPPFAGKALATGEYREILNSWEIFHSPGAGLSVRGFSEDFIKERPDVVQGFVNALYRAHNWIDGHLDEAKEIVAVYLGIEPDDLSSFYYDREKNITQSYIEQWFEIAESIGLWEHGEIQATDIFTNEFVPDDLPEGDATLKWDGKTPQL